MPDLPPASPASEVQLRPDGLRVDNAALLESWPAGAVERVRGAASDPAWPRVSVELPSPLSGRGEIEALRAALESARRAERAATGNGQGAGTYNLRVAETVPFGVLSRVLFTSAMAGYGPPRVLLDDDDGPRALPWPASLPRVAPTRAQIEALVRGGPLPDNPDAPAPPERPARVALRDGEPTRVTLAGEPQAAGCAGAAVDPDEAALPRAASPAAIGRCLAAIRPRTDEDAVTIEVAPDVPFAQLSPVLQHAIRVFDQVRIRRQR